MGFLISYNKKVPDPERVQAILGIPPPTNLKEWQAFKGFVNYYRDHIPRLATDIPSYKEAEVPFGSVEFQQVVTNIKQRLCDSISTATLQDNGTVYLDTDFSKEGISGIISQVQGGREQPIMAISRKLRKPEKNYSAYHGEALAFVWALRKLRHMLFGRPFTSRIDNQGLSWLKTTKDASNKLSRWLETISEFNFTIAPRKGVEHVNADFLSRFLRNPSRDAFSRGEGSWSSACSLV